ncbi:exodeoxyribonuclease VII large subunit [Psychrobium sp. 1_MG-2023]|uniref:exodeoxyribonuclease VII large subunit n=1 Tax=Psychrobium sp. 1_MG-2023 TaxID=3062624 RepID=UPI000C338AC6|nr:exodeoxyribonuclease VII large subunit [Psychrobium sp. 1_MG-2023]MDP2560540.1 exodeoxyribonuclease VII large subunit [Psychrobium sp. 1_MG-2023]PKF57531.1 exodeoxyribonuclease VII large subunit [Alteromonadales bacterium alter-6D02]
MQSTSQPNIYNVSKLNNDIKRLLEGNFGRIWLNAEVSNFVAASSGHWYFTLKDARSQIKCAMFKGRNRAVKFRPQNGQQIMVKANVSVYEPRGDYQLLVDVMDMAGDGLLQQQFEQLKCQLASEGLFATEHKKPLPSQVKRIGIITSPTGAAVQDILTVLKRRNPLVEVVIYPAQVQGQYATNELVHALEVANYRQETDLIIIGRGGGSLEDLWCFNNETLARTIFSSQIPVISAVGHEVDITISDFVADYRAPTPSAAAEIAVDSNEELINKFNYLRQRLVHALTKQVHQEKMSLQQLAHRLSAQDPKYKLQQQAQYLDELNTRLISCTQSKLNHYQQRLHLLNQRLTKQSPQLTISRMAERHKQLTNRLTYATKQMLTTKQSKLHSLLRELNTVSPLATLERGYSISYDDNESVITSSKQVKTGMKMVSQLHQGKVTSIVESIE